MTCRRCLSGILELKHQQTVTIYTIYCLTAILGLQSFPRESKDKDMAAMLDDITKEANEKYFVNVLQHGGYDVTCKRRIPLAI
jgi:hypothetical protein